MAVRHLAPLSKCFLVSQASISGPRQLTVLVDLIHSHFQSKMQSKSQSIVQSTVQSPAFTVTHAFRVELVRMYWRLQNLLDFAFPDARILQSSVHSVISGHFGFDKIPNDLLKYANFA